MYANNSAIYYLRISYLEHHKYILITISYYNPSYETLSTSSIIHLFSFTYHTVILSYFDTLITVIFSHCYHTVKLSFCYTLTFLLWYCHTIKVSQSHTITVSQSNTVTLLYWHTFLLPPHSHGVTLSFCQTVTLLLL